MNLDEFLKNFIDQFEDSDQDKITVESKFKELNTWDSLTMMMVIGCIKTEYDIDITATEINNCDSVEDVFNFLLTK